jgi:hypothetical protein
MPISAIACGCSPPPFCTSASRRTRAARLGRPVTGSVIESSSSSVSTPVVRDPTLTSRQYSTTDSTAGGDHAVQRRQVVGVDDAVRTPADHLGLRVAEHVDDALGGVGHPQVTVEDDDRVGAGLHEAAEVRLLDPQRARRPPFAQPQRAQQRRNRAEQRVADDEAGGGAGVDEPTEHATDDDAASHGDHEHGARRPGRCRPGP